MSDQPLGAFIGTITNTKTGKMGGKQTPYLLLEVDYGPPGEKFSIGVYVWLTPKGKKRNEAVLKMAGFQPQVNQLSDVIGPEGCLTGNEIPIDVFKDPQYGIKAEVPVDGAPLSTEKLNNLLFTGDEEDDDDIPF